ncbi:MAG: hypothetical protein Q7S47_00975 [bacterium]|nr:hypothetical protein [bacterium]
MSTVRNIPTTVVIILALPFDENARTVALTKDGTTMLDEISDYLTWSHLVPDAACASFDVAAQRTAHLVLERLNRKVRKMRSIAVLGEMPRKKERGGYMRGLVEIRHALSETLLDAPKARTILMVGSNALRLEQIYRITGEMHIWDVPKIKPGDALCMHYMRMPGKGSFVDFIDIELIDREIIAHLGSMLVAHPP